ncbi:MAG: hypothetical protein V7K71_33425 [Nostoc sp.]
MDDCDRAIAQFDKMVGIVGEAVVHPMTTKKYVYWQDEEMWLGYLEEYPDYWTQAETENELKDNLTDIYKELTSGTIPNVL